MNRSISPKDGTRTGTSTLGQSGPGSNNNGHYFQVHSTDLQNRSLTIRCGLVSYTRHLLGVGEVHSSARDTDCAF